MNSFAAHLSGVSRVFLSALCLSSLVFPGPLWAGGTPAVPGGGTANQLMTPGGGSAPPSVGDYIGSYVSPGIDEPYVFYVEVPTDQTQLQIELFDADVLAGGAAAERTGERDQNRTGGVKTNARYQVFAPDGTLVPSRFAFGDNANPPAADAQWKTFFDSTTALITGGTTYRDEFSTNSYSNNDGSANFAGPWVESNDLGEAGSTATAGDVQVTGGQLRLSNASNTASPYSNQPRVAREVDLSAAAAAVVTFDWSTGTGVDRIASPGTGAVGIGDSVSFEVSSNGGTTWTQLDFFGQGPVGTPTFATYDITDFISVNTQVRFRISNRFAGANETFFVDDFQIRAVAVANGAAPTEGHWRVRADHGGTVNGNPVSAPADAQDDVNAFGIRAHDGTPSAGGQEYNVYADSFAIAGINDNDRARDYQWYPYVSSGCSMSTHDFDWDANQPNPPPPNPNTQPYGSLSLTSRDGSFIHTNASMSNNDVWRDESVTGYTSNESASVYGVWRSDIRIEDWTSNNYGPVYFSDFSGAAAPPTSQPEPGTFRIYLPTDSGTAPAKPYLGQFATFVTTSAGSNPPTVGQTSRYAVTVTVDNPVGSIGPITFSPSRTVTSTVPGGDVTYGGLAFVTQGTVLSQPAIGASGTVEWNPGSIPAGGAQARITYFVDVSPSSSPYSLDLTGDPALGSGTQATWLDETQGSSARAEYTFGELCELRVTSSAPIPAVVASLDGYLHAEGLELRLETATEAGSTDFEVFRVTASGRDARPVGERLTATLDAPQGGVYRIVDPTATDRGTYFVVERAAGQETVYGPFEVLATERASDASAPRRATRPTPDALAARLEAADRIGLDSAKASGIRDDRSSANPSTAIQPMALEVTESALHRLDLASLSAAGGGSIAVLEAALDAGELRLRTGGEDVAWRRAAGGSALEFWGQASDSPYSSARVYVLEEGAGLQMAIRSGSAANVEPVSQSFREALVVERDLRPVTLLPLDPEGDFWFWDFLRPGADALRSFEIDVPSPSAGKRQARLSVHLQGAAPGVHRLDVRWNGTWLGTASVADLEAGNGVFDLPSSAVLAGENTIELQSVGGDLVFVDRFELRYDRLAEPEGGVVLHRGDGLGTVAGPFTKPWIWVYDLADPYRPVRRTDAQTVQRGGEYWATWRRESGSGPFLVHEASGRRAPTALRPMASAEILDPANAAEHLIVAASSLVDAAREIADHRTAQGVSSTVVDVQAVYDALSFGQSDPRALREFFALVETTWPTPPRSVLLVGAGTYDYRDLLGIGGTLLPPMLVEGDGTLYATDQAFVDFDGDGLGDLPIGRLPALVPAEVSAYAEKLAAFEEARFDDSATWRHALVTASDDADFAGDFGSDAARLGSLYPTGYETRSIDLGTSTLADARAQLDTAFDQGFGWLTYVGHGAIDRLAAEGLLTSDDVSNLSTTATPVVFTASCHVALHAVPGFDALGEALTLADGRGAVAVIAPSWLTQGPASALLADRLLRRVFQDGAANPDATLGDRLLAAIADARGAGIAPLDLARYQLLGDPALLLPLEPAAGGEGDTCVPNCGGPG